MGHTRSCPRRANTPMNLQNGGRWYTKLLVGFKKPQNQSELAIWLDTLANGQWRGLGFFVNRPLDFLDLIKLPLFFTAGREGNIRRIFLPNPISQIVFFLDCTATAARRTGDGAGEAVPAAARANGGRSWGRPPAWRSKLEQWRGRRVASNRRGALGWQGMLQQGFE
jgi:hypothetical protein